MDKLPEQQHLTRLELPASVRLKLPPSPPLLIKRRRLIPPLLYKLVLLFLEQTLALRMPIIHLSLILIRADTLVSLPVAAKQERIQSLLPLLILPTAISLPVLPVPSNLPSLLIKEKIMTIKEVHPEAEEVVAEEGAEEERRQRSKR